MSTIVVKTAKRNTRVTRVAVRQAVDKAYSKNGHTQTASKKVKPAKQKAVKQH